MKLTDTDLDKRDREWVERVVQADEELLLVCKPLVRLWRREYLPLAIFAVVWWAVVSGLTSAAVEQVVEQVGEKPLILLLLLFFVPFWCVAIGLLLVPWWTRALDARTVYLLTNRRVMVLRPSTYRFRQQHKVYPLEADMIKEIKQRKDGSGDVVLGYEARHTKNGTHYVPRGLMHVPQVGRVAEALQAVLPAAPAGAEEEEESREAESAGFPNILTLLVGGVFVLLGGSQCWQGACQLWENPQAVGLVGTVITICFPLLFCVAGGQAVRSWYRDFVQYCNGKRKQ